MPRASSPPQKNTPKATAKLKNLKCSRETERQKRQRVCVCRDRECACREIERVCVYRELESVYV